MRQPTVLASRIVPASTTALSEHKDLDQPSKTGPATGPLHFDPGFIALGVNVDRGSAIRERFEVTSWRRVLVNRITSLKGLYCES